MICNNHNHCTYNNAQINYNETEQNKEIMTELAGIKTDKSVEFDSTFDEIYEGAYISHKTFNNEDFDYQHLIEVVSLPDEPEKCMIIWGVSKTKEYISREKLEDVCETACITEDECNTFDIFNYGLYAMIDNETVLKTEIQPVLETIANRVNAVNELFGFYMDRKLNRIGNTGWDFLDGQIG